MISVSSCWKVLGIIIACLHSFCILRYIFVASLAGEGHCSAGHAPRCRAPTTHDVGDVGDVVRGVAHCAGGTAGTAGGAGPGAAGGLARVVAWHVLWHAFGTECWRRREEKLFSSKNIKKTNDVTMSMCQWLKQLEIIEIELFELWFVTLDSVPL